MPRSFQEIERAREVQRIAKRVKSREDIVAEQDARNEAAVAEADAAYDEVFGADEDDAPKTARTASEDASGEPEAKQAAGAPENKQRAGAKSTKKRTR